MTVVDIDARSPGRGARGSMAPSAVALARAAYAEASVSRPGDGSDG
ncbi:hypothetical protein [Actinoplanes sp. NPDC020271]